MENTQKPIKATLDSSDDSVKTQKPILIQLDDIPTPEAGDAGKVLGVDEEGKYALTEGVSGIYYCDIEYDNAELDYQPVLIHSYDTPEEAQEGAEIFLEKYNVIVASFVGGLLDAVTIMAYKFTPSSTTCTYGCLTVFSNAVVAGFLGLQLSGNDLKLVPLTKILQS